MCLKFWDFQGKNDQVKVEICCNRLDVFGPATDKMMAVQVYTYRFVLHF